MSEVTPEDLEKLAKKPPLQSEVLWCGKCGQFIGYKSHFWYDGLPFCSEKHRLAAKEILDRRNEEIQRKRDRR